MKHKLITVSLIALTLSGCGIIGKKIASEESIKEKASFAIGTPPGKISITNVRSTIDSVKFDAEANGAQYSCYYTTAIALTSDAICQKMDGQDDAKPETKKHQGQCNALLKAAGRC